METYRVILPTRLYNNLIALFDNWDMYKQSLEESRNAMGTLQTLQDIYMESTAAHLQQLRTAAEGVYDSLLNTKDINSVVDVFTGWTKDIETAVDGLGGLKGILMTISPLMISAFSSNLGQIFSLTFSNFTIKQENAVKLEQLKNTLNELNLIAPESTKKYLGMKEALADLGKGIDPAIFNKLSTNIEKAGTAEANLQKTTQSLELNLKKLKIAHLEAAEAIEKQKERLQDLTKAENIEKLTQLDKIQLQELLNNKGFANIQEVLNRLEGNRRETSILDDTDNNGRNNVRYLILTQERKELEEIIELYKLIKLQEEESDLIKRNAVVLSEEETLKLLIIKDLELEGKNLQEQRIALLNEINSLEALNIELLKAAFGYIGQSIGQFASMTTSILNIVNLIDNILNIFDNDDLTAAEKLKLSIAAIAALITTAGFAINGWTLGWRSLNTAVATFTTIEENLNTATVANTMYLDINNKKKSEGVIVAGAESATAKINTKETNKNSNAKIINAGASEAEAIAEGTSGEAKAASLPAIIKNSIETKANTAAKIANAAATVLLNPVTIIAGVVLLTAALAALAIYLTSNAKKEKDLAKATEEATEAYQKLKEAYLESLEKQDNLNNLIDAYKEQKKALDDLVEGTEEWNKLMDTLGATVDLLLNEYPELMKYAKYNYSTGNYTIDEKGLEEFLKKQQEVLKSEELATTKLKIAEIQANIDEVSHLQKTYGGHLQELLDLQELEIAYRRKYINDLISDEDVEKYKSMGNSERDAYLLSAYNKQSLSENETETARLQELFKESVGYGASLGEDREILNEALENLSIIHNGDGTYQLSGYSETKGEFVTGSKIFTEDEIYKTKVDEDVLILSIRDGLIQYTELTKDEFNKLLALEKDDNLKITNLTTYEGAKLREYEERESKFLINNSLRNAYNNLTEGLSSLTGLGAATKDDYDKIAEKLAEAYETGGIEGIEEFEKEWANKPVTKLLEFKLSDKELSILELKMAEIGISKEDILRVKVKLEISEDDESLDLAIANWLASEESLNHVYQDRVKIFKDLNNYDGSKKAHREEADSVANALSGIFGLTVDKSFVIDDKNLKNIETFFNRDGTKNIEERTAALKELINTYNTATNNTYNDIQSKFTEYEGQFKQGEKIEDIKFITSLTDALKALGVDANSDEMHKEFEKYGYFWNEDDEAYYYYLKFISLSDDNVEALQAAWEKYAKESGETFEEWMTKAGYEFRNSKWYKRIDIVPDITLDSANKGISLMVSEMKKNGIEDQNILEAIRRTLGPEYSIIDDATIAAHYGLEINIEGHPGEVNIDNDKLLEEIAKGMEGAFTAATIEETYTPVLDLSAEERQIDDLTNSINRLKDAQKDLNGEALVSNIDLLIELEGQLYEAKVAKINKEKEYQAELRSSFSQEKTRIKNAMADDEKTSGLESQYKEYSFTYDSEGYIKNANEVDKLIWNDILTLEDMKEGADEDKQSIIQAQINDLTALQTSYSNFASSYNSSLENTTKLTEEEYEYLKLIRSLEEDRAKAAADRTNATKAQLTALDKESTSLSKALETLGDASDYSGQTLINYNESYSKLLDDQTKNAEARQKVLAEEQSRLKEGSQGYLSDIGINLDDYKLEDGTYDIDAMAAKVDEMTAANKDNVQEVENINHAWKMGKYGVENLNKDIEEQKKLCDEVLKITKEQARVKWSTDFAQVNKELSDIETKLGRADKQLTRSKSLYDKLTTEGKINMMSSYYGDIDAVDEYYDKLDSKLVEKAKTLGDKLQEDGVNMPSILKDYFSLDDPDEIFGNYNTFMENLEDTKDKILEETLKARDSLTLLEKENKMYTTDENGKLVLTEEAETLTKKIEDLGSAYEMLGTFAEEADRKEERALNKQPDMSAVLALSKEWKSAAVDREIKKVNRELTLLQKLQSRLKGKDVIANLQLQVAVIQKHIKLEQKKLELMKSELKLQKTLIQGSIKRLQLESLGSAFDADGHVSATFLDALSKKSDIANDKLQDLISSLKEYESMMSEIESQEDVIVGLQDDISDKNYEIAQKIKEETRKAAEKALNQFKINLEIALDAAEAFRKIDRLQAKIDRLRETDWFNQSVLDYNDAISYATNDVTLLTDAVNKLIGDYNSGAWKDMYDTLKDARDDIMSYANQLMDAVQSYYDAIDSAKEKYASAIDSIISANQDLINDFERIKKYANQGINLTKLLPGGGNDKDIEHYYDLIDKVNKKEIDYLLQLKDYYKALLSTLDPLNQPDLFKSVKSAYDSIMEEIDAKTAESILNYTEGLKESIERAARAAKLLIAELSGYASPELQQIAHDRQDQILKDYYDVYESEYEIASLANKYTKAISETDNLAHKKELTKVMQEQLKLLKEQAGEEKRLTKYEVDRANAVYELTLRLMALDEAKANKSLMRLRRDTQGNYRYEYVGDEAQTADATLAVLDAQYKIYELDKNRLVELTKTKEKILDDYTARLNEILDNQYMTTELKEAAVEELRAWYLEQSQQLYENYAEAVTNINESSAGNLDDTLQEMIDEVGETADEAKEHFGTIDEKIVELADDMDEKLRELEQRISEAMEKIGGSIESVQDPIDAQIDATQELIDVDKELIDEWENQVSAMQNMLDMLASLESQYRALMEAALAAADAAARLQVTDFSTADERDSETTSETNKTSTTTTGGGSDGGSESKSKDSTPTTIGGSYIISDTGKTLWYDANTSGLSASLLEELLDYLNSLGGASLISVKKATLSAMRKYSIEHFNGDVVRPFNYSFLKFDTGGYTGEWGTDGRIAMLHQKELVLNAKDTENFLLATLILRTLQNNINEILANVNNGLSPNVNVSAPAADLNQNVHIEANFPNVSNSREIEEAFNNLVNMASLRAMSTRR